MSFQSIDELTKIAGDNIVPVSSSKIYKKYANDYKFWSAEHNLDWREVNPDHFCAYVQDLSSKYKTSTIWTRLSGIKMMLLTNDNLDINPALAKANKLLYNLGKQEKTKQSPIFSQAELHSYWETLENLPR